MILRTWFRSLVISLVDSGDAFLDLVFMFCIRRVVVLILFFFFILLVFSKIVEITKEIVIVVYIFAMLAK